MMAFEFFNMYSGTELSTTIYSSNDDVYKQLAEILCLRLEKNKRKSTEGTVESEPKRRRVSLYSSL